MSSEPLVILQRLDPYCLSTCKELRCDGHRDCGMLKFRRGSEVRARLSEIASYLEGRHTAVFQDDLVRRFFLDDLHRRGLDQAAREYLLQQFERILSSALLRDTRFEHRRAADGRVAWAPRGATVSDALLEPRPRSASAGVAGLVEAICRADGPIPLRALLSGPVESEALSTLASELRDRPEVRCVFIDAYRGLGTHWVGVKWLLANLPSDARLRPIPPSAFLPGDQNSDRVGASEERPRSVEDEDDEPPLTSTQYVASLDDVVAGSLLLDPVDHQLFPSQPNPLAIELRDLDGTSHPCLVLTRDGRRELLGMSDVLLEAGGTGIRLRLFGTATPHVYRVETDGISQEEVSAAELDDRLARRVWRALLSTVDWRSLDELVITTGASAERVRAVLEAHRCFEPGGGAYSTWRLDRSQPALRPRSQTTATGEPVDEESLAIVTGLIAEARSLVASARNLKADLDWLAERAAHLRRGVAA